MMHVYSLTKTWVADGVEFIENLVGSKVDSETKLKPVLYVCQVVLADQCNELSFLVIQDNPRGWCRYEVDSGKTKDKRPTIAQWSTAARRLITRSRTIPIAEPSQFARQNYNIEDVNTAKSSDCVNTGHSPTRVTSWNSGNIPKQIFRISPTPGRQISASDCAIITIW
jgi:hypothetical protein